MTKKDIQASVQGATYTVTLKDRASILEYRHLPPELGTLTDDAAIEEVLKAAQGDKVEAGDIVLFDPGDKADEEKQGYYYSYYDEDLFLFLAGKAQAFRFPASGALLFCARTGPPSARPSGTCLFPSRTCSFSTCLSGACSSCACSLGTRHSCLLREFSVLYIKAQTGCQTIW